MLRLTLEMKGSGGDDNRISTNDVGAIVDRQIFLGKNSWT